MIRLTGNTRDILELMPEGDSIEKGDTVNLEISGSRTKLEVSKIYRENEMAEIEVQLEPIEDEDEEVFSASGDLKSELADALAYIEKIHEDVEGFDLGELEIETEESIWTGQLELTRHDR